MEPLYRKVEIKSEVDLPGEISVKYFVMFKDGTYCKDKRINPLDPTNMQVWTSFVDWYLQPQEPEWTLKEAEQYLNDCIEKATPRLSKIKDVDKALDEIRGIEPKQQAEEFIKDKLNEKTGQGITLYEHYLAHDTTISIGTAVSWMEEYAQSQQPKENDDLDLINVKLPKGKTTHAGTLQPAEQPKKIMMSSEEYYKNRWF